MPHDPSGCSALPAAHDVQCVVDGPLQVAHVPEQARHVATDPTTPAYSPSAHCDTHAPLCSR